MAEFSAQDTGNLEDRELCEDGDCIGLIGDDGRCRECGRPGKKPTKAEPSASGGANEEEGEWAELPELPNEPADDQGDPADKADDFDEDRRLCADDDCIGIVGSDNRCRECGKSAA